VSTAGVLVHNTYPGNAPNSIGRINYGSSDLSQLAKTTRLQTGEFTPRNLAVFEYRAADGSLKTITTFSERGVGHAERLLAKDLEAMGVDPSRVTRIFSELEPCQAPGGFCKDFIQLTFPNAKVSWAFEYGDAASRATGIEALREALKGIKP
jgi:hypothetical protein